MIKNKRGDEKLALNKLIIIILAILVLLAILMFIYKVPILEWLRNLPDYTYDEDKEIEAPELIGEGGKPLIPVAVISEGGKWGGAPISFCGDERCTKEKLINSKLKWNGNENSAIIEVEQGWDNQIGEVSNGKVKIYDEILKGTGELYFKVKNDLPNYKYLLNLDGATYFSGILYRNEKVVIEEKEIPPDSTKLSNADISFYKDNEQVKELLSGRIKETGLIKLVYPSNNENNRLGFDTGGNAVEFISFKMVEGKIYVRFADGDYFKDYSPWILMDYWNNYKSFVWVPKEYILKEK